MTNRGLFLRAKFWSALPWVALQALKVKRTAPRFAPAPPPREGELKHPENHCQTSVSVLGIGDSIIAGVGTQSLENAALGWYAKALRDHLQRSIRWQALGESGADCAAVNQTQLAQLPAEPVDHILISVGVNDCTGLTGTRRFRGQLRHLLESLHQHSPRAVIAVIGLPPMQHFPLLPSPLKSVLGWRAASLDLITREECGRLPRCVHVAMQFDADPSKFSGDGYHPNEDSCREIAEEILKQVVLSVVSHKFLE